MKKLISFFLCVVTAFSVCGCSYSDDVILSLGRYSKKEFYTSGSFQDFTDYAKYTFKDADLAGSQYFSAVTQRDVKTLNDYVDNFENWVEIIAEEDPKCNLVKNYDFDRNIITVGDSFFICDRADEQSDNLKYEQFEDYNVYFFDVQSNVLYYFHNNI